MQHSAAAALTNGLPSVLLGYLFSSMQMNMECGKSAMAALGVVVSLMVFPLAQSQVIGKYSPASQTLLTF